MTMLTDCQLAIDFSVVSNTNPWTHADLTVVGTLKVASGVLNIANTPPPWTAACYATAVPNAELIEAFARVAYPSDLQAVILVDPDTGNGYALRAGDIPPWTAQLRLYPVEAWGIDTVNPLTFGTTTLADNDEYGITYDGSTITAYKNDVSQFTFAASGTLHPGWLYNVDNTSSGGARALGFTWGDGGGGGDYATVEAESVPGDFQAVSGVMVEGMEIEYETLGLAPDSDVNVIAVDGELRITYTGENPEGVSFQARAWDPSDEEWGEWATITLTTISPPPTPSTNLNKRFIMEFLAANAAASRPLGYQQITDLSVPVGLTVPKGTCYVIFKPNAQAIRFRDDGTDPTDAVGYPVSAGYEYIYTGASPEALKIVEAAASATLDVLYYGRA